MLGVPDAQQGDVAGTLVFWHEVVIIALVGLFGALSDRMGRRRIYSFGFATMAIAYFMFPYAESVGELTGMRMFFAIGAAAVTAMLATVLADYPSERARGVATGLNGVVLGLGIMLIVFVLSKLPIWFKAAGYTPQDAGQMTFWITCGLSLIAAVVVLLGLKAGVPSTVEEKKGILTLAKEGLSEAKNPKLALSYGAAFVSRGDLAVVGTFLSLWIMQDLIGQGLSSEEAFKKAGMIFGICQGAALFWAPVIGIIADKISRVGAVVLGLFLAAIGYGSMGFVDDVTGPGMLIAASLMGIGEISGVIASQALVAQEAPVRIRGSVVGMFGFFGAIGILIATKTGGVLFDAIHPSAPFVLMGVINALIFVWGLWVMMGEKKGAETPVRDPGVPATYSA